MKKLICAKEVEALAKAGKKVFCIDSDTIVTPAARDAAKAAGIEFSTESGGCAVTQEAKAGEGTIDSETIYNVLKALMDKGLLNGIFDQAAPEQPYKAETDCGGFKVVRGNTVKLDVFDTGIPENKVFYQELFGCKDKSPMSSGFLTLEKSTFSLDVFYDEIYYVIDGVVTITVNDKTYAAYTGDEFFIPVGAKVTWSTPDKAKLFYATYPAIE